MMARTPPSIERQNRMAAFLLLACSILIAASAFARFLEGGAPPQPHGIGALGRAMIPGLTIFLFGTIFLMNQPASGETDPETLPRLQRPSLRRRIAFAYFALGAALILVNFIF
jgi:hypothetical protein